MLRRAPERTPFISAAPGARPSGVLLLTRQRPRHRPSVRAEAARRLLTAHAIAVVSVLLSLFLARTIARPLRRLARAAHRVRLGRAREVAVPRLPSRRDEIGMLARALAT